MAGDVCQVMKMPLSNGVLRSENVCRWDQPSSDLAVPWVHEHTVRCILAAWILQNWSLNIQHSDLFWSISGYQLQFWSYTKSVQWTRSWEVPDSQWEMRTSSVTCCPWAHFFSFHRFSQPDCTNFFSSLLIHSLANHCWQSTLTVASLWGRRISQKYHHKTDSSQTNMPI